MSQSLRRRVAAAGAAVVVSLAAVAGFATADRPGRFDRGQRVKLPLTEVTKQVAEYYYAVRSEWFGDEPGLQAYIAGWGTRGRLIRTLAVFLERYSMALLPVSAEQAFEQGADLAGVDSMRRLIEAQWSMMAVATLGFPALSVPTGVVEGLPIGVQLLGRRFDEARLLYAGEVIEARAAVLTPIDPVPTRQPALRRVTPGRQRE